MKDLRVGIQDGPLSQWPVLLQGAREGDGVPGGTRRKRLLKTEAGARAMPPPAEESLGPPGAGRGREDPAAGPPGRAGPASTSVSGPSSPELRENALLWLSAPRCVVVCYGGPRKLFLPQTFLHGLGRGPRPCGGPSVSRGARLGRSDADAPSFMAPPSDGAAVRVG